jgi:hypothetical protein
VTSAKGRACWPVVHHLVRPVGLVEPHDETMAR